MPRDGCNRRAQPTRETPCEADVPHRALPRFGNVLGNLHSGSYLQVLASTAGATHGQQPSDTVVPPHFVRHLTATRHSGGHSGVEPLPAVAPPLLAPALVAPPLLAPLLVAPSAAGAGGRRDAARCLRCRFFPPATATRCAVCALAAAAAAAEAKRREGREDGEAVYQPPLSLSSSFSFFSAAGAAGAGAAAAGFFASVALPSSSGSARSGSAVVLSGREPFSGSR